MRISVENISPEKAKSLLEKNAVNRRLYMTKVNEYAYYMQQGKWQLNGETIVISQKGFLKNGQHRLNAIIKSKKTIPFVVVRGVEDDTSIYDRGKVRNITDSLIIEGMDTTVANKTTVAIAKLHYQIQKGSAFKVTDLHVKYFLEKHSDTMFDLLPIYSKNPSKSSGQVSPRNAPLLLASLYAIESGEDKKDIYDFADCFRTGFTQNAGQQPAILVRNAITSGAINVNSSKKSRYIAECVFEKAIYDFCRHYPRRKAYGQITESTYSHNIIFKEDN